MSHQALAAQLAEATRDGASVRFCGGRTKFGWGANGHDPDVEISTAELTEIVAYDEGDLTAVVDAGVTLHALGERAASADQMLALDPPLGSNSAATIGGAVATADSGPLRHRYGSVRDLVLGMTVALSDGTVARSGGTVIKNVAGYDIAKLFAGAYGTLGAILQVAVRLHPRPPATATAVGASDDPRQLAAAAAELSHARLELQSLDLRWEGGAGAVLARFGGANASDPAAEVARTLADRGLDSSVDEDDTAIWDAQRAAQRSHERTVVRVSGLQDQTATLLDFAARHSARVVGRAGLGLSWITLDDSGQVEALRAALDPSPCVVLDVPSGTEIDAWGPLDRGTAMLMERVRERFDPARTCAPGLLGGA